METVMSTKKLPLLLCLCLVIVAGCQEEKKAPCPPCPPVQQPTPVLAPENHPNVKSKTFYCESCPVIRLDTTIPAQVQARTEFEYSVVATNVSSELVTNIVLSDILSSNFQSVRSNPQPTSTQGGIKWVIPQLAPGQSVEIKGMAIAPKGGEVLDFIDVTFNAPVKLRSISLEPKLVITKSAPAETSACAPILYIFKIENVGNGTANNVRLYDTLPQGLTTSDGKTNIDMPLGALNAGASKTITLALKAASKGTFVNTAVALADGDITSEAASVTTIVKKPMLTIASATSENGYVNMETPFSVTVTNTGDWPAINTVIENVIPQGFTFVRASQGASFANGRTSWKIERLNPGQSVTTSVTSLPNVLGPVETTFTASAECTDAVTASAKTTIKGAPGVLLEVGDTKDPVRIGQETKYRIVITNQGAVTVTNIAIKATLDPAMVYVNSVGATSGQFADGVITFAPLGQLAPRTQAIWEVTVKANAEADARFKLEMTGDQLTTPVFETESTHFFQ